MNPSFPTGFERVEAASWTRAPVEDRGLRYDAMGAHRWYANLDITVDILRPRLEAGDVVVDYSAGTGLLADRLLARLPALRMILVDASAAFLRVALEKLGKDARVAFRLLQQNGQILPLDAVLDPSPFGAGVDAIVSTNAVHLYPDLDETFAGWRRTLRPGGLVVVQSAEIDRADRTGDDWLITDMMDGMRARAREVARRDASFARYRAVLDDPSKMQAYDRLYRRIFLRPKKVDAYVRALERCGFSGVTVTTDRVEVGVAEWLHAALVYPDTLAWVGGSVKVDGVEPSAEALADRRRLMAAALRELFGERETFQATWTHLVCRG